MCDVRHPYVWPVLEAAFLEDRDRAAVLCPFARKGSLRDVMHRANPTAVFGEKYRRGAVGPLPAADIALYGRQILEALIYLTSRRCRVSHLHCGNILVEKRCCYLAGVVENELLGMSLDLDKDAAQETKDVEVLAFGRVLFEMSTGVPLRSNTLPRNLERMCQPPFLHILRSIFAPGVLSRCTLQDLLVQPAFAAVQLLADVRFIHQIPLDARSIRLLSVVTAAATEDEAAGESPPLSAAGVGGASDQSSGPSSSLRSQEASRDLRRQRRRRSAHLGARRPRSTVSQSHPSAAEEDGALCRGTAPRAGSQSTSPPPAPRRGSGGLVQAQEADDCEVPCRSDDGSAKHGDPPTPATRGTCAANAIAVDAHAALMASIRTPGLVKLRPLQR